MPEPFRLPADRFTQPPAPVDPTTGWRSLATSEAQKAGLPPDLVLKMIDTESGWKPDAVSPKGARGLMQLMPDTAKALGVADPHDPAQAIPAGVAYLKTLVHQFHGDLHLGLAAYNAGPDAVTKYGGVPPFPETQNYIRRITSLPTGAPVGDPVPIQRPPLNIRMKLPVLAQASELQKATSIGPEAPPWIQAARSTLPAVGSMLGGAGGAAVGGVAGGPLGAGTGALAGAGFGGGVGEAAELALEAGASYTGLSPLPPPSWDQIQARMIGAPGAGMMAEAAGQVGGKVMAPFAKGFDAEGRAAAQMFPESVTPGQVSSSRAVQIGQNIAEGGMTRDLLGGKLAARSERLKSDVARKAFGIVEAHGGPITPETAGTHFQDALAGNTQAFKQQADTLYAGVDQAAQGVRVPTTSMADFATQELEKRAAIPGEVTGNSGLRLLKQVAAAGKPENTVAAETAASLGLDESTLLTDPKYASLRQSLGLDAPMGADLSFKQAHYLRGQLSGLVRRAKGEKDDVLSGVGQQLIKRLDAAMEESAKAAGGDLLTKFRTANEYYKSGMSRYQSELMRGLADEYPSQVVDKLFKPGAVETIREAKAAVGPAAWQKVRASTTAKLLSDATNDQHGTIEGAKLLGELRKYGKPTMREVYEGSDQDLWQFATALERVQRNRTSIGKWAIQGAQIGAAGTLLASGAGDTAHAGAAAGVLLTPAVLSKIMGSRTGLKWLTAGLEAPRGTKLAARAATHLAAQMVALGLTEDDGGPPADEAPPEATPAAGPPQRVRLDGPPPGPSTVLGPPR